LPGEKEKIHGRNTEKRTDRGRYGVQFGSKKKGFTRRKGEGGSSGLKKHVTGKKDKRGGVTTQSAENC